MTRSQQPTDHPAFQAFLSDLACLGVTTAIDPDRKAALRYSLLQARSNPRWWVLPRQSTSITKAGLAMFQPVTRGAKIFKHALMGLSGVGLTDLWTKQDLILSGQPELLKAVMPTLVSCAYFTGTEGPHRKTAIQMIGAKGAILGYAKISQNPLVQPFLKTEADALQNLAAAPLASADVPGCLHIATHDGYSVLVTDTLKAGRYDVPTELTSHHLSFLREMMTRSTLCDPNAYIETQTHKIAALRKHLPPDWAERLDRAIAVLRAGPDVGFCEAHGDFTASNCFVQRGRLYVFDWEYAQSPCPAGYDYVHFTLSLPQSTVVDQAAAARQTVGDLRASLAQDLFDGDTDSACHAILWALVLHAMFYTTRLIDAGQPFTDWPDALHRATLIDTVLAQIPSNPVKD